MINNLTVAERRTALSILGDRRRRRPDDGGGGRGDPMGVHGFIVMAFAGALFVVVGKKIYAPEPPRGPVRAYYDDPTKVGIIISLVWAVIGMGMGVWVASQLAWPDLRFDAAWSSFGRLRPLHTSGVIFGFGGNALIATSFHVMQRTGRARLPDQLSPLVRAARLQPVLHRRRQRLPDGRHPVQGVRRARVVRGHLAGGGLGDLFRALPPHARPPQRAAHLRRQLVLHGLHPGGGGAAHRQQPGGPRVIRRRQELLGLLRASRTR